MLGRLLAVARLRVATGLLPTLLGVATGLLPALLGVATGRLPTLLGVRLSRRLRLLAVPLLRLLLLWLLLRPALILAGRPPTTLTAATTGRAMAAPTAALLLTHEAEDHATRKCDLSPRTCGFSA